jgi:hypothetical protein
MFLHRRIIYLHGGAPHGARYMVVMNLLAIAQLIVMLRANMK